MKNYITLPQWKKFLISASNHLSNCRNEINSLNFFPVPDADTGTNMSLTIQGCLKLCQDDSIQDLGSFSKQLIDTILYSSKGNSGVILSEIIVGFCTVFAKLKQITIPDFCQAILAAKKKAFHAILEPVSGTILDVIADLETYCSSIINSPKAKKLTFQAFLSELSTRSYNTTEKTKSMMPELNKNHLSDSGAMGLHRIFEAFEMAYSGQDITLNERDLFQEEINRQVSHDLTSMDSFGYCCELIILLHDDQPEKLDRKKFAKALEDKNCNSIISILQNDKLKVHAHTLTPGIFLGFAQDYGSLDKIKIDNMSLQVLSNQNSAPKPSNKNKKVAIVIACSSQKLTAIFESFMADLVLFIPDKKQPVDTKQIASSLASLNVADILLFPNNKLSTNDVNRIKKNKSIASNLHVIETNSNIACLRTMFTYDNELDVDELKSNFETEIDLLDVFIVNENETQNKTKTKYKFITTKNNELVNGADNIADLVCDLLASKLKSDYEIITLVCGKKVNHKTLNKITNYINVNCKAKLELIEGKQTENIFEIAFE